MSYYQHAYFMYGNLLIDPSRRYQGSKRDITSWIFGDAPYRASKAKTYVDLAVELGIAASRSAARRLRIPDAPIEFGHSIWRPTKMVALDLWRPLPRKGSRSG